MYTGRLMYVDPAATERKFYDDEHNLPIRISGVAMKKNSSEVIIRKAEDKDCAAVQSIALAAYAMYLDRMPVKPYPMLDDYSGHIRQGRVYVLESDKMIYGYVVLVIKDADTLLLDNIAVRPEGQGSGYGRDLAHFAEEQGRRFGCKRICLYTNEVMTENIGWYERLGYSVTHQAIENGYRRIYMAKDVSRP